MVVDLVSFVGTVEKAIVELRYFITRGYACGTRDSVVVHRRVRVDMYSTQHYT